MSTKNAAPKALAGIPRQVTVEVFEEGAVLVSLSQAAALLGISGRHLRESLTNRESYLHGLQRHVFDLAGGLGGKPLWRVRLSDVRAFVASCPKMGRGP